MTIVELRHIRYFVAVAEEGSFTRAAEQRLHTAQPSLSRQIRDLEIGLGVDLIVRRPKGLELTPPGLVFLDHARAILLQVEAASEATRRAARPAKTPFVAGFLTGSEMEWLPKLLEILSEELAAIELTIHSAASPELTRALRDGSIDLAFLRPDDTVRDLAFRLVTNEKLFALLPSGHRLASRATVRPRDIAGENFINFPAHYSPVLRQVIDAYFAREGLALTVAHEAETLPMVISLVLSTGGVSLLPEYARKLLPPSVVARSVRGRTPVIPLAIGYSRANKSPLLQRVLARADDLLSGLNGGG